MAVQAAARSDETNAGVPQIRLNDGNSIPQLGMGVWEVPQQVTARVVRDGIAAGFRLIDTAEGYHNEEGVGEAIKSAGVPRSELFITSKLRNGGHDRDAALKSFDATMKALQLDQLDMFLIHWPVPSQGKYVEAWKTLIELQQQGRVKSIGVSNFNPDHLERIVKETGVVPVVDQIFWAGYSGVTYLPASAAPIGQTGDGLPIGVQIVGPQYGDYACIQFAKLLDREYRSFVPPPAYR